MSYVLPTVGSRGLFVFSTPISGLMNANEIYTCQAVRTIREHESGGTSVLQKAYLDNNLDEDQYLEDKDVNMHILSLQSDSGKWSYIPARFVQRYPDHNGVPYHANILTVALQPLPSDTNYTVAIDEIKDVILRTLGVTPVIDIVEASAKTVVTSERNDALTVERADVKLDYVTTDVTIGLLQRSLEEKTLHIQQLEAYIATLTP